MDTSFSISKRDKCKFCNQVITPENILDNFCRSDFVVKTKLKKVKKSKITFRKGKVLKLKEGLSRRKMRRPVFLSRGMNISSCCENISKSTNENFLVMGKRLENGELVPTLVMPWNRKVSKFRKATRMFKKFDCSDPSTIISEKLLETGGVRIIPGGKEEVVEARPKKQKNRENGRKKKKGRKNRMNRHRRVEITGGPPNLRNSQKLPLGTPIRGNPQFRGQITAYLT
ncbi:Secreted frizzled-related protein 2 [Nymphon striatum]|nr:Secreted frizzled-related protein 2 [Nymphon striatum]